MLSQKVRKFVLESLNSAKKKEGWPPFDTKKIFISRPEVTQHGDYSTNAAFILAGQIKRNPHDIAKILLNICQKTNLKTKLFEKIEMNGGFINFFLSKEVYIKELGEILKLKDKYGQLALGRNQKIQVEFVSANPTGPLTIGNARGGPFGDCLANVLVKAGYNAKKEYYVNDCGNQIIALGHSVLKDDLAEYKGDYVNEISKNIKGKDAKTIGRKAAKFIIEKYIKKTVKLLGIDYDKWFFESDLRKAGKVEAIIRYLTTKGLTYEKDGALWFKSIQFGDERDRVLLKKDEEPTYLAVDIAYHLNKFKERKFKEVINIWGADHFGDVAGLQAGVSAIGFAGRLKVILLQFVTLYKGQEIMKMSKRAGVYVTMNELLDMVGKDAARYFFLSRGADTHLNFDIELAKKRTEANPVFYIQYAYARICSVFKKASLKNNVGSKHFYWLDDVAEINLIKTLILFPEIIEEIAKNYQVQKLAKYALDLATAFHKFYQDCRLITEDDNLSQARLALALATRIVLGQMLTLMGISAPEKM